MKNRLDISNDGINVYAKLKVNASKKGTYLLSMLIILEIALITYIGIEIGSEELLSTGIIPILIVLLLIVGWPVKYLLWNIYGNEEIVINTKSISWSYDYGFYKTKLHTLKYDRLGTGYERIREVDGVELGRLIFCNYNIEDNLPEHIHNTTVLLDMKEIEEINNQIDIVFKTEFLEESNFIPFSDN